MKHFFTLLLTGVLVVMAFVFASYVVFMQFRPEREISFMLREMAQLQTVSYDAGFSWSYEVDGDRVATTLYAAGETDITESENIEYRIEFRSVHLSEDPTYNDLSGEIRKVDGLTYLMYEAPGPDVEKIEFNNEKWIEFTKEELPGWGAIVPGLDAPLESMSDSGPWTGEGVQRMRQLLSFTDVFYIEYNGLTQIIDGANTRIIDGYFDQDAVEVFLLDLIRAKDGRGPDDEQRILAHTQAEQISGMTVRFWIGIQDHLLYRIQGAGAFIQEETNDLMPVDIRVDFSDHNQVVEINEPQGTTAFTQILTDAFGGLPEAGASSFGSSGKATSVSLSSTAKLPVTQVEVTNDPDNDGLDNLLERFYGTDMNNPDTDGDGMTDGEEVRSGMNPRGKGSLFSFGLGF
ncbi:MAG: hypothetical protein HQ488_03230 [Parcubacteria group bacterium]|nr:hypothetical protein [Parcubacteria group bacterium]